MDWQEIWRGTVAGGREVVAQEDDDGDVRVNTTTKGGDRPLTIEPEDGEGLEAALANQGDFTAEEATYIAKYVETPS